MKDYSVFDILGPIMIGPSSSHTAGAARLGKVARDIAGGDFSSVKFILHGSFAMTYRGHGTDRALVAGVLGMEPYDERLRDSMKIAEEKGIKISFVEGDLGDYHENTVKIIFNKNDGSQVKIIGSSIGGGSISIKDIDGYKVDITGDNPTLIVRYIDKKGMISKVTTVLAQNEINIGIMTVNRRKRGKEASMIIETDSDIPSELVTYLIGLDDILSAKAINPVKLR